MSDTTTSRAKPPHPRRYRGGCPCGAVLWEVQVDLADPNQASDTVWQRNVPARGFKMLRGENKLSGYQFFANSAHHFFCVRCSAHVFSHQVEGASSAPATDVYTIDLRSLQVERAVSAPAELCFARQRSS